MHLILRRSGVHRAACFALSRALLRQAKQLPLPKLQQDTVETQIKEVLRRNVKLQSSRDASTALRLGYETLESLRSPTRWKDIITHVLEEGARRSSEQRRSAVLKAPSQVYEGTGAASPPAKTSLPRLSPYPGAAKVLDRPHANLSGRRHVPKLVNANRVPILRFKKPQSPFLSRIIRDTIRTREARLTLTFKLQDLLAHANDEDQWDRILAKNVGISMSNFEYAWSSEIHQAITKVASLQAKAGSKRIAIAAQMQAIVEKEKALAMEEKAKREKEKYIARKARYYASIEYQVPLTEEQPLVKETAATEELLLPERTNAIAELKEEIGASQGETQPYLCTVEDRAARNERNEGQVIGKGATLKSDDEKVECRQPELDNEISVASRGSDIPLPFVKQQDDNERLPSNPGTSITVAPCQQSRDEVGLPRLPASSKIRRIPLLKESRKTMILRRRYEEVGGMQAKLNAGLPADSVFRYGGLSETSRTTAREGLR